MIGQKGVPSQGGGVERYVEELSRELVLRGHDVFVYCRSGYTGGKEKREHRGIKLIYVPTFYTKHLEAIVHTFLCTIHALRQKADVLHYQAIGPSSLIWIPKWVNKILKKKTKVVVTYHCKDYKHQKWNIFARWYLRLGERMAAKYADVLIANSKGLASYAGKKYGSNPVYIPYGARALPKSQDAKHLKKWNLETGGYIFIMSRFIKHKGIHYLIDAYKTLDTTKKLVIAGDGAYTNDYKQFLLKKAADHPNIIFVGNQTGEVLGDLLENAYCFAQPSEAEGLSIALLEAMKAGKACVVSDIPENLEAVQGNGIVFENKNSVDLAEKLQYALKSPEKVEQLGALLKNQADVQNDWERIAEKTESVYIA